MNPKRIAGALALLALVGGVACGGHQPAPAKNPVAQKSGGSNRNAQPLHQPTAVSSAILFASPRGEEYVDRSFMKALVDDGFAVDWTERLDELTPERVRSYNVVVLYASPSAFARSTGERAGGSDESFTRTIRNYVESGGGVLLMPEESNLYAQRLRGLTELWGARITADRIVEADEGRKAMISRGSYSIPIAFTEAITPSPVTVGVKGIWYPTQPVFLGALTLPIMVDENWDVLVRGSNTSRTEAIALRDAVDAAPGLVQRSSSESSPALFAVRTVGRGRVALMAQWPQFSFASGTKWLYDDIVLQRGANGRPSDFRKLLENTLRWLSEPSRNRGTPGGFSGSKEPAVPNAEPVVRARYRAKPPAYEVQDLQTANLPEGQRVYRGLVGAGTHRSGADGSVQDYARAARRAGLDFVIFLEDFSAITKEELVSLRRECVENSDADLLLLPGFHAVTNVGNPMFFFGPRIEWPPDAVLTGEGQRTLRLQQEQADGSFTGASRTPFQEWILKGTPAGYYDFGRTHTGMRLYDARMYALAGIRYYRSGQLVEDVTEDYLLTNAGTIGPTPIAIHVVKSPRELIAQAKARRGLTYVVASSLSVDARDGVFHRGLHWKHQFETMQTFVSSGPEILVWPQTFRADTYGAEGFSPERSVMFVPLVLRSTVGLQEYAIYDGNMLFRRVRLHGKKDYRATLVLDGGVQRTLVVIAKDVRGGTALSYPVRSWSDGSDAPVFCSDHTNDCDGQPLLARGPFTLPICYAPSLPSHEAGLGWDGAPHGAPSALGRQVTLPTVYSGTRTIPAARMTAVPMLEFSDEGATGVMTVRRREFDDRMASPGGVWSTFGPLSSARPPFTVTQRYRQWLTHSDGAPPYGHAAFGSRHGGSAALFSSRIAFRRRTKLDRIQLASIKPRPDATIAVFPLDAQPRSLPRRDKTPTSLTLRPGDAVAAFGGESMTAHVLFNRAQAIELRIGQNVEVLAKDLPQVVRSGEDHLLELGSISLPVDPPVRTVEQITAALQYLRDPAAITVLRGERLESHGLVDVRPLDHAAELKAGKAPFRGVAPVRVLHMNPRWSAGVLLLAGNLAGFYGPAENRYRALGVSAEGVAHVPLDASTGATHMLVGHPVVADDDGRDLFIQATCLGGSPYRWHISVNNVGTRAVRTTLRQAMALPGLTFEQREIALQPGQILNLQ